MCDMLDQQTDLEVMRELGSRLRAYRIQRNIPVEVVAESARLNRNTVMNAEAGKNPRLATIVRLLRVLGRLEGIENFLPTPTVSPLQELKRGAAPRRRASGRPGA
jgi:transcriptional regulator with XRE-family HTH domain